MPGHPVPSEVRRLAAQLADAPVIVRAEIDVLGLRPFASWPEVVVAMDGCEVVWGGQVFQVYRRVRPPRTLRAIPEDGGRGRGARSHRGPPG